MPRTSEYEVETLFIDRLKSIHFQFNIHCVLN